MRKLARHELDMYDEVKRHLARGDVVRWVNGPMAQCWQARRAIERMPRGWKGCGDPQVWITAIHNLFPHDLLLWAIRTTCFSCGVKSPLSRSSSIHNSICGLACSS